MDIAFLAQLLNEYTPKDDEMILSGFLHETTESLRLRVVGGIENSGFADFEEIENFVKSKRNALTFMKV